MSLLHVSPAFAVQGSQFKMAGRRLNNLIAIAFWENSHTLLLERVMQLKALCYHLPTYCDPSNVLKVHFLNN